MLIDIRIDSKIFNRTYLPYLDNQARTQIFFGGSSSGKSFFIAQRVIKDLLEGGRNYLIARSVATTIKKSVFNEVVKAISSMNVRHLFVINKTSLEITCNVNNYQILFCGLDDVEKIKSITPINGVITDIWIEEATEIDDKNVYNQLKKRLRGMAGTKKKRIILSFNPVLQTHWIYETFFNEWDDTKSLYNGYDLTILKTTYKDNRFLAKDDIYELEHETDKYFYDVYTLGNWGVLGAVIYKNWEMTDLSSIRNQFVTHRHGLDFGFSQDPSAAVFTHHDRKNKTIYVYGELYKTELTNDLLAAEIIKSIKYEPIYCDCAEPKSIRELTQHGVYAQTTRKGKSSVNHGIQFLQQYKIIVDISCINFKREIQAYHWKTDHLGNVLPIPVGKADHLMDALRYAYEDEYREQPGVVSLRQ